MKKKKKKPRRDKNTMSSFSYTFTDFEAEWFFRKLFLKVPHGNNLRVSRKLLQIVQAAKNAIFLAISLLLLLLLLLSLPPSLCTFCKSRKNISSICETFLIYPETLSILEATRRAGFFK
jgi:hypothetical protein